MYCSNCGAGISENSRFCPACGREISWTPQSATPPTTLRGFSPHINNPAFTKYLKNTNRYSAIFSLILAVVAVLSFFIAGEIGVEDMSNPQALFIGLGVGSMFLVIALFQILGRKRSVTWDGIVENKTVKKKTHHDKDFISEYIEYSVIVRSDRGKKHVVKTQSSDVYNYFNLGDRVRHHAGLKSLEKYDKTGDTFIPCNACGTLCDIREDYCYRCKCPLLK